MISKKELKNFLVANFAACEFLIHSATGWLFFISGIGRFRTIALISGYFFLKGVLLIGNINSRILTAFFAPLLLVLFFQDLMTGQIFPIFTKINPLLFMACLFAYTYVDTFVTRRFRKIVEVSSGEHFFGVCPRCRYEDRSLRESCLKCGYKQGMSVEQEDKYKRIIYLPNREVFEERIQYKEQGLTYELPHKALLFLGLEHNDAVLIGYKKTLGNLAVRINGSRELIGYIIFTTRNIILLHYFNDKEGWRFRETIPYGHIIDLSASMRRYALAKSPTLRIKTAENTYELPFRISEIGKLMAMIKCIMKRSPRLDARIDIERPVVAGNNMVEMGNMDIKDVFKWPWRD